MTARNSTKWIDLIPKLVNNYNNSNHRTIDMKPADVRPQHTKKLLNRLYNNKKDNNVIYQEKYKNKLLKVGAKVRIVKSRNIFSKESTQKWTDEVFIVRTVERRNFPITYLLVDQSNEIVLGSFYREELQIS